MAEMGVLDRLKAMRDERETQSSSSKGVLDRLKEQRAAAQSAAPQTTTQNSGSGGVLDRLKDQYGDALKARSQASAKQAVTDYNSLVTEYKTFASSAQKALSNAGYNTAKADQSSFAADAAKLRQKAEALRKTLGSGRSSLSEDTYSATVGDLDAIGKSLDEIMEAFNSNVRYFDQWGTEDDYNAHAEAQKTYEDQVKFDQAAGAREIAAMQEDLKAFKAVTQYSAGGAADEQRAQELRGKYGSPQDLEKLIGQKQAYANTAARIQKGIAMASVADKQSASYDSEFDRYAQAGSQQIAGLMRDLKEFRAVTQYSAGGAEDEKRAQELRDKYGSIQALEDLVGEDLAELGELMTREELSLYGYYHAKNGPEAAKEYLDGIRETLNYRAAQKAFGSYEDNVVAELAFGAVSGLNQFGSNIKNLFNGDDYIPTSKNQYLSGMVRENLADNGPKLPEKLGGASLGQVAYDAINTSANMAPSILASMAVGMVSKTAGSALGLGLMGASSAGGAYQEKLNLGYSKAQAGTYAAMVGASEVLLEKVLGGITQIGGKALGKTALKGLSQVDNVIGRVAKKVGSSAAGKILTSGLSEAAEEGLQSVLEPVLWNVVSGNEIDIEQEEVLYSALLGAVTGTAFEAADAIPDAARNTKANRTAGRLVTAVPGGVEALKQTAGVVAQEAGGDAQKGLESLSGRVKNQQVGGVVAQIRNMVNTQRAGKLYRQTAQAVSDLNAKDIASALNARGWDWDKATAVGKAMAESQVFGQSREQSGVLEQVKQDPVYREVLAEVAENSQSTVVQRLERLAAVKEGRIAPEDVIPSEDQAPNTTGPAVTNENTAPEGGAVVGGVFDTKAEAEPTPAGELPETGSLATPISSASGTRISDDGKNVNAGDGKAHLRSTGEAVGIMGVSSVKDGTVRLKLEDGRIVDAKEVEHSSAEEALVYETATRLSDNALAANMLIENYNGETSALEYTKGIEEAWLAGKANAPRNQVQALPFASRLAENQRWTAYKLGQISAGKNAGAAVAANPPQTARKRGYVRTEGMTKEDVRNTFNMAQKESYGILNTIAKVTGIDMVLYRSTSDNKGNLRSGTVDGVDVGTSQGMFSWKNDKIYIDVNAGVLNAAELGDLARYAMLRTFDHEFTHFMEKYNPEEWAILKDAVFSTMRRNGTDPDVLVQQYMDEHSGVSRDAAEREVVAEAMVDILPESRFVEELAQKHRSIFVKLLEKLKRFVQRIRNHFAAMGASRSAEPAAVKETVDGVVKYAEGLAELFDRVAVGAVENYQAQQTQKNAADGDRVQMQVREIGDTGKFYVQADRQVLTGEDPSAWGKQIEKYINEVIRKEQDIAIPTQDGHVLLLTGRSAYKLSDAHVASIQKKVEAFLTDESYALKGRAATHIDELIQVARFDKYRPDTNHKHENDIGEDGFNYFEANFRDFDGVYYRVAFSAALNASEENVYSIGRIEKRKFPTSRGSSSDTEALKNGRKPSGDIIYTSSGKSQEVKSAIQLAYEKALAKKSSGEQHQDRVGTITNRDIIAESEGKTGLEREKIAEYQKLVDMSREQAKIMAQRQRELAELEAAGESRRSKKYLEVLTEMNKAKNRMNNYEGQIRRMENGVLEPLINREKGRVLEKLRNTYGTISKGEKAVRDDSLPVSTDGKNRVSRTARTVKGAGVTPDDFAELIDAEVTKGGLTYLPISSDEATQKAIKRIMREGWEEARVSWAHKVRSGMVSAELSATGALLLNNAARAGDREAWLDILHDYQHMGTAAGQAVQALRILKQLLPDDKLYMAKRSISQMVADMHLGNEIEIDPELEKAYQNAKSEEEQNRLWDEITKNVAQQLPATFMDKWTALRYTNMLGNLRTQIRNLAGNVAMKGVSAAKNLLATGLENLAYQVSGGKFRRTKSVTVSKDMRRAAKADFAEVEALVQGGGKYSTASAETARFAAAVKEQQRIFKSKLLEGYRKGTSWAMEAGDLLFSRAAYARALAGYLKANGVNDSDFSKIDAELLNDARLYAVREAQEVTFRDTNALSGWVSKIGRDAKTPKAAQWAIEGILPFRKTPANVLVRAEEYSPLGFINAAVLSIKAAGKDSEITGTQVVESWSKALTGTGLFALGILLSNAGILIGGPDDDDDLDRHETLNGQQNYALKIGDVYITVDWLSPAAIPLFMGAQLQKAAQDGGIELKELGDVLSAVADPMIEMSMLQGLNDAIDNVKYSGFTAGQFVIDAMTGYLTQALTNTLLGQIERGFEKNRMFTYVNKDSAMPDWMQKTLGKASAKTPGWDYSQVPYINAWGEEEQNPKVLLNLIYNMLSPSYVSTGKEDRVSQELTRLNEVQSDVNVFPKTPEKEYEDRYLSSDEYVELASVQGRTQRKIVEDMVEADLYAGLPDAYKAKAVEAAYKYARERAQIDVLGREEFSSDWMTELGEDTAEGIVKHVIKENIKSMYLAGDITAEEAIRRRMEYHGDSRDEAKDMIAAWDFKAENPQYSDWSNETVTKYKELEPDTAAHVIEVLSGLKPEGEYTTVRTVQKLEAIVKDRELSSSDREKAMRANMDDKLEAKFDAVRDMGIGADSFTKAYRKYLDTSGEGKKANVVAYYKKTFGISKSKAEKLYDLFVGKRED